VVEDDPSDRHDAARRGDRMVGCVLHRSVACWPSATGAAQVVATKRAVPRGSRGVGVLGREDVAAGLTDLERNLFALPWHGVRWASQTGFRCLRPYVR